MLALVGCRIGKCLKGQTCSCTSFVLTFHIKEEDCLVFLPPGSCAIRCKELHAAYEFSFSLFFHRVLLPSAWLIVRLDFVPSQMDLIVTE